MTITKEKLKQPEQELRQVFANIVFNFPKQDKKKGY